MEIVWKVYWTFCLLIVASGYLVGLTSSNPTPLPSVEPTVQAENETSAEAKSDLDLQTQDQVAILKQINRVNDDGSYTFGYEAADGSFKIETRDVAGNVKGMFGFINEDGELKRVSYSASNGTGFQSTGSPNIPPLPGMLDSDEVTPSSFKQVPNKLYQQIIRPRQYHDKSSTEQSTRINLLPSTTTAKFISTPTTTARVPIYIYGTTTTPRVIPTTTLRPVVIQHIPKVRPTPATSSTEPADSEEITFPQRTYLPKKSSTPSFISFGRNDITSTTEAQEVTPRPSVVQVLRPRVTTLKKIIVTKRPVEVTTARIGTTTDAHYLGQLREVEGRDDNDITGNGVRRQLGYANYLTGPGLDYTGLVTSGTEDSPDVYGGTPTPRPYPANLYRQLFTQVPQHQRILQNSYIQNQNQYLAAAIGAGLPPPGAPQATRGPPQTQIPVSAEAPQNGQVPQVPPTGGYAPQSQQIVPQPGGYGPQIPPGGYGPQISPGGYGPPQGTVPIPQPLPGGYGPQDQSAVSPRPGIPPSAVGVSPQYLGQNYPSQTAGPQQQQQYNPSLYIPPALMEQIIRMILLAQQQQQQHQQQRQQLSPFQQALVATLGAGNVPQNLLDNRYDPRYQAPPYNQPPYQLPPPPPPYYDPRYQDPRYSQPYTPPYQNYQNPYQYDPRYTNQYQPLPPPRAPYIPRSPYGFDPGYQQNDESFLLRMLLSARYPPPGPPVPPEPSAQIQHSPSTVERATPVYGQRLPDSTTAPSTLKNRFGAVRNVQILDPVNDSESAGSSRSTSSSTHRPT